MVRYQELKIRKQKEELVRVLGCMKHDTESTYTYKVKLTKEYAKNVFVNEDCVACFKTNKKQLFRSCIFMLINNGILSVQNIVPFDIQRMSVAQYNFVLMDFYENLVMKYLDETFEIDLLDGEYSICERMDAETWRKLELWESTCNKDNPVSHQIDYNRWMDFVISAHLHQCELFQDELGHWLKEDRNWQDDEKVDKIVDLYRVQMDILKASNNEDW